MHPSRCSLHPRHKPASVHCRRCNFRPGTVAAHRRRFSSLLLDAAPSLLTNQLHFQPSNREAQPASLLALPVCSFPFAAAAPLPVCSSPLPLLSLQRPSFAAAPSVVASQSSHRRRCSSFHLHRCHLRSNLAAVALPPPLLLSVLIRKKEDDE